MMVSYTLSEEFQGVELETEGCDEAASAAGRGKESHLATVLACGVQKDV